jgi:hypothetical protein
VEPVSFYELSTPNACPLPVGVQNHCGVATEQRDALWKLASLLERDDGESTATTGFPIDSKMLRVDLFRPMSDRVLRRKVRGGGMGWEGRTLIRLVSHAFREIRRLS